MTAEVGCPGEQGVCIAHVVEGVAQVAGVFAVGVGDLQACADVHAHLRESAGAAEQSEAEAVVVAGVLGEAVDGLGAGEYFGG